MSDGLMDELQEWVMWASGCSWQERGSYITSLLRECEEGEGMMLGELRVEQLSSRECGVGVVLVPLLLRERLRGEQLGHTEARVRGRSGGIGARELLTRWGSSSVPGVLWCPLRGCSACAVS